MGNDSGNITVNADELCNTYVVGCDNGAACEQAVVDMAQCGMSLFVSDNLENRCQYAPLIELDLSVLTDDENMAFLTGCSDAFGDYSMSCYY